ncbi:MAG: exonuclease SbcCD subunit D [Kiritimatiellae bacterium]|nr:exonuclease SbcCD subunit D [Kiritimatiellia bacterium]
MKIIHTGDWHLGHRLYNYDNTEEEDHFFRQLAEAVSREQPDALVVCGDVFDTGAPGNDVARRFTDRLLEIQLRCPDMTTVVIAGNHDSYSRLVVDEALWRRCRVRVFGVPAEDESGLADFAKNIVEIPGKGVIVAVPFCHPRNFPSLDGVAGENRDANYFEGLAKYVADHSDGLPAVLMAHLAVKGDLDLRGHDNSLVIGGEECVGLSELGSPYDYIALGHIHCPQWIKGERKVARYCGTPRAIRFDETYNHGVDVVTVEVGKEPAVRTEVFEPLRMLETIGGDEGVLFEEALRLVGASDLPVDTYIRLNVRMGASEMCGPDWTERARKECVAKGFRFCVINPIREEAPGKQEDRKMLTMAELRELSNDEVLHILSARHELSDRQRELVKSLMK